MHFHVNSAFRESRGQDYIGSRDIDLGIHVDSGRSPEELERGSVGGTMRGIEGLGFVSHRFGFKKSVDRDSGETLTEDEARQLSEWADETGKSESDLLREAVREYLDVRREIPGDGGQPYRCRSVLPALGLDSPVGLDRHYSPEAHPSRS